MATFMKSADQLQLMWDLLCCAFEGGSNYWYRIDGYVWPDGMTRKDCEAKKAAGTTSEFESDKHFYPHLDLPAMGGGIKVRDVEGDKGVVVLDLAKCKRGLKLMSEAKANGLTGAHHWANVLKDDFDAETGDVFLQLALWGETIYG